MKLMQNVSVAVARKSARIVALRHTDANAGADVVGERRVEAAGGADGLALLDPAEQQRRDRRT
jgi:hypothetical protein